LKKELGWPPSREKVERAGKSTDNQREGRPHEKRRREDGVYLSKKKNMP